MMNDPVVCAIISAIPIVVNTALDETLREATRHAYKTLKERIKLKFGGDHAATTLISEIEKQFDNDEAKSKIIEKIAALKLGNDPEILDAARSVSDAASVSSTSPNHSSISNYYGQVYGSTGDHASVVINFGFIPDAKKA